jgi:hypothetical protein
MSARVLVFDIETAPMTAYVWGLKDQNIALNQIIKDWSVMSWAAKWLGEDKVMYMDVRAHPHDDKEILKPLWKLLDEADIVITQYGSGFDSPRLNARFIMHGMKPPSPYKHLDTYRIVKKVAAFTSNKLEYLTDKLCVRYKKLTHKKFSGMSLWTECLKGNLEAWEEMKKYNIHDVLSTEELYMRIRSWTSTTAPAVYESKNTCEACGSKHVTRAGYDRTKASKWQRLHCQDCGKWMRGKKVKVKK